MEPEVLSCLLQTNLPLVIDADGLRLLARHPEMLPRQAGETVLTPHLGEMKSLMEGFGVKAMGDGVADAKALSLKTGCIVVLKGRFTVVASPDGTATLNVSGGPALSTAGSGDVLTGVIAALAGQGMSAADAARLGVYLHGLAGDMWNGAQRAMSADDLADAIGAAWQEVSMIS